MAVTYGFYDSLNHDRLYNAQQMSAIFDGIINDGVFMSVGNQFHTVAGTGMQVIVKSGRAWFDSTWTLNDAEYPLSIDAADVLLTRIDAVVLEVNSEVATRANTIKVVKGTPASTPAKPTLTNTATVHQHALAYVTVAKNTTAITNSMIEIVVGKTETPYVTAILETTDITDLFKKWENDFQVWFETVKGTLDGDVALNLQNQIDHCVKKADKATSADIAAGTADKWVDASSIFNSIINVGCIITDYSDSLRNNIDYQLITDTNASLDIVDYPKLFNLVKYRYGCYQSFHKKLTVQNALTSVPSEAYNLYGVSLFRVLTYNGHVYTYTRLVTYTDNHKSTIIMKDDTVLYTNTMFSSSNVYTNNAIFVYNNRFYELTANYNSHTIAIKYWDATTEQWSNDMNTYNTNSDNVRASERMSDYSADNSTIIIKNNNNIYCHVISSNYRCLITFIGVSSITVTPLGSSIHAALYDNGVIYGVDKTTTTYYTINPLTGESSTVSSSSIPNHVYKILSASSTIFPNIRYINSDGTEYVIINNPTVYSSYNTKGYYVKYVNGKATIKDIDLRSYFTISNYKNSSTANFYMMHNLYFGLFGNANASPLMTEIDTNDDLYVKFYDVYNASNTSWLSPLYADRINESVEIYLPMSIKFNKSDTTAEVTVYKYDGNYFNISPRCTDKHVYMKVL